MFQIPFRPAQSLARMHVEEITAFDISFDVCILELLHNWETYRHPMVALGLDRMSRVRLVAADEFSFKAAEVYDHPYS